MSRRKTLQSKFLGSLLFMLPFLIIFLFPSITLADPVILYTDILSGPNTGEKIIMGHISQFLERVLEQQEGHPR